MPTFTNRAVARVDRDFRTGGRMSVVEVTLGVWQRDGCSDARVYVTMRGDASAYEYSVHILRGVILSQT